MPPDQNQEQTPDQLHAASEPLSPPSPEQSTIRPTVGGMKVIQPTSNSAPAPAPVTELQPQTIAPETSMSSVNSLQPTPASPSVAAEQQVGPTPYGNPQGAIVSYGHNDSYRTAGTRHLRMGVVIAGISSLVLLIGLTLYLLILPAIWSSSYVKNVKPLYQQQTNQIKTVYQSIGRPVFTSNNSSSVSDTQDLQYITGLIETATHNTDALKNKDHLIVLPGTTWQHSVSTANTEYQAMQQYVSDSQTFLQDYKSLTTYVQQISQIAQVQLPRLVNDTNAINKGTSSESVFIADLQATTTDLQSFVNQVKGLKPPIDLQGFNQNLLTSLNDMNKALSAQKSDLQNNNSTDFRAQLGVYVSAYENFANLLNSNPTANLQTSSTIHNQVTTLEGERPIK